MEESSNSIVESRETLMISPINQENPTLRTAHFLKPSVTSNLELPSLSFSCLPPTFDLQNCSLTVNFHGWRYPQKKWNAWVGKMASLYESTWKKAGVHDAILSSTYQIQKNSVLVLGVAERWCPETNSFIFPWGEATVSLEDIMMISGYSVLGSPVFNPLQTEELKGIEAKLVQARLEIVRTPAKKACQHLWLRKFMESGSQIEHEAFLSLWLSRFVLPTSSDVICECVFPIAIHLARGTRIALAPAVLASIYRDLSLLKEKIVSLTTLADTESNEDEGNDKSKLAVTILSPFQLVLVWVWERFVKLRPNPNLIKNGEPRLARWNNLKCNSENVRLVLGSSKESFNWRPYTRTVENWDSPKFYRENEMWASVDSELDEELLSFLRCVRVAELVGVDCIEQYLPHRVARQFGLDQDIPGFVARSSESPKVAWSCYRRSISDVRCYVPSRFFETDVTTRYLEWWNSSVSVLQGASKGVLQQQKSSIPKLSERYKGQKFGSSFKIRAKSLKEKNVSNSFMRSKVSRKSSVKKGEAISSFKMTPKIPNREKEDELFISSFRITPKSAKEKEGGSDCINYGFPASSSKVLAQNLKRKKNADASAALDNPAKQSKTLVNSSRRINENNGKSTSPDCPTKFAKTVVEINNLPVPPGFPPKCDRIEARDMDEEDGLTIAEMLKSCNRYSVTKNSQSAKEKNLSVKPQSHSSHITGDEAHKTSALETSVEVSTLQSQALENEKCGDSENAIAQSSNPPSSTADNEALNVLDPVTSGEGGQSDAAENRQNSTGKGNGKNASNQSDQSQNHSSSIAGSETFKNTELQAISAEKFTVTEVKTDGLKQDIEHAKGSSVGSQAHKMDSRSENKEGSSSYAFEIPELNLEARIRRLEKRFAVRKAAMFGRVYAGPNL